MARAWHGMNLGGWLVAERWMTPSLFTGVVGHGERALARELGVGEAARRLAEHRTSFITEADFSWLAREAYEVVRIPVGYWACVGTKDYIMSLESVDRAFAWAERYGLWVILDLHGLPGSQNGKDHSGETGKIRFYRPWNRWRTLKVLRLLAGRYGRHNSLLGVQIINEPTVHQLRDLGRLLAYYHAALKLLDGLLAPHIKIIVGDAWQPQEMVGWLKDMPARQRLVLDLHLYQAFSPEDKALSVAEHLEKVRHEWRALLEGLRQAMPIMVGEWSGALDDCTYRELSVEQCVSAQQRYRAAQQALFRELAWCEAYWSYYAPGAGAWSYRKQRIPGAE